ncbi:MAG: ABC transporter permease [Bacteroidota bacterium]
MSFSSLRYTLRSLARRPGTTLIHTGGLAVGIACCFLALLYVQDERSYDRFHEDAENIFAVRKAFQFGDQQMNLLVASDEDVDALKMGAPGVLAVAPTREQSGIVRMPGQDEGIEVEAARFADASFFDVFTFPLLSGNPATALSSPNQTLLSESLAQTLFGTADVIGELVTLERTSGGLKDSLPLELTISGVVLDPPKASSISFQLLISGSTPVASSEGPRPMLDGGDPTYVRLASAADTTAAIAAMNATTGTENNTVMGQKTTTYMPALVDEHLEGSTGGMTGNPAYLTLFSAVAALILLLACINYANLATALAAYRATEVGVRKALGAGRRQLGAQFLGEALLLATAAGAAALALTALVLPVFNAFFDKDVSLTTLPVPLILGMGGIVALAGLVAGLYPALVLTRFQPARVLSGLTTTGRSGAMVRRGLVVFQFTVTTILLGGTLLVAGQLDSVRSRDLGFQGDQVVVLDLQAQRLSSQRNVLKNAIAAVSSVERASVTSGTPGGVRTGIQISPPGTEDDPTDDVFSLLIEADAAFQSTLGLQLVAGSWYSDEASATVLNESAARVLGIMTADPAEAVGQMLGTTEVVGVVRDFHMTDLRQEIMPMQFLPVPEVMTETQLAVKIDGSQAEEALSDIEGVWKATVPEYPFAPEFVDDQFADQLRRDRQLGQMFGLFAGIAVLLACFGMFGLAAHAAERRTKEFGVRKVLGASVSGLVARLSREFVALVVLALVLAAPVVAIGARRWLEGFAYPAAVEPGVFVALAAGVLVLALATVSVHALRVALADPVQSLRSE